VLVAQLDTAQSGAESALVEMRFTEAT
jgi:hypothetical protein